jgi:trimethylamine--corrinoid protein Co-methyltransferase
MEAFIPFSLTRRPLMESDQAERIYHQACRVLAEVGLEIHEPEFQETLQKAGLRGAGKRIFIDQQVIDEHVAALRQRLWAAQTQVKSHDDRLIHLQTSSYGLFLHDPVTDQVIPYTTERLVEMTKFIDSFTDEAVGGAPPGIPGDVHPDLMPIAQYRIAALYARQGATPVDPTSARTVRYLLDMAEVMDRPITSLPVYLPTPLRLGGESLQVVLACLDRLEGIWVGSMPSTGSSAPLQPFGAFVLAAAEVLGGLVTVHLLTGKPVTCSVSIFPSSLREGSMVFGSPESMLFQMLSDDFNRFLGHVPESLPLTGPNNIHDMAKLPDCQSAAEKAAILMVGAALGTRWFSGAGMLSLDEIFSPEQFLVDCEIRDWVQRAIRGIKPGENDVSDWVEEIREGMKGGFTGRDSTLDHYREYNWFPRWFQQGAIGAWNKRGQPRLATALKAEVQRRIARHSYEPDAERRRAIEAIYNMARRAVEGG